MYSMRNQIRTVGDSKQSKDDDFMRMCMELLNRLQFVNINTYNRNVSTNTNTKKIKMKTKIKLEQVHGTVKSVASSRQLLRSAPHASFYSSKWVAFNVNHTAAMMMMMMVMMMMMMMMMA